MKHRRKMLERMTAASLSAMLMIAQVPSSVYALEIQGGVNLLTEDTQVSQTQFTYPQDRSFEEINQYFEEHPYDTSLPDKYDIEPDIANKELNDSIGDSV